MASDEAISARQFRNILDEMLKLPNDALPVERTTTRDDFGGANLLVQLGAQTFTVSVRQGDHR